MTDTDPRLTGLDGFRVEIDAESQRGDIVLDRPPFNVVMKRSRTMPVVARGSISFNSPMPIFVRIFFLSDIFSYPPYRFEQPTGM